MITFKAIIIPNNRRKDGTYPVKIRITFKGVSRRLPTTLICNPNDVTRGNKIKNADILNKADDLIGRMRTAVRDLSPFELESKDVDWVVSQIHKKLSGQSFRLDFFEWSDNFLKSKSETTRKTYEVSVNAFSRYLGKRELDINFITRSMLMDFVDFVESEPKMYQDKLTGVYRKTKVKKMPGSSALSNINKLQHIFNAAKRKYNNEDSDAVAIPRSPFSGVETAPVIHNGQKSIGVHLMQKMIDSDTENKNIRLSLDIFIVSFGLMGANLADLYEAQNVDDIWIYNRQKTRGRRADKAEMRVYIPDELAPFIGRLREGRRPSKWWLPNLRDASPMKDTLTARVNRNLKRWCLQNGVQPFTLYAARHTWATLARKAGVEKATIDECLCHVGDYNMADIYAERDWERINEANTAVLNLFKWK